MNTLYSAHPSMFKNSPIIFILTLLLIPVFGLGLIILLGWYIKTKGTKLSVTENDIELEEGLLSKDRSELSIKNVRTVKVKQSFFNRILGVGAIEIYTAGDKPEIAVSGLPNPNKIRDIVKSKQNASD